MHFLFVHFSSALPEKVNWNAIIELFARRIFLTENEVQIEHRVSVTSELLKQHSEGPSPEAFLTGACVVQRIPSYEESKATAISMFFFSIQNLVHVGFRRWSLVGTQLIETA